jgi:hypothetical protein
MKGFTSYIKKSYWGEYLFKKGQKNNVKTQDLTINTKPNIIKARPDISLIIFNLFKLNQG